MKEFKRALKALLLTLIAYLIQACVMRYLTIGGVTGNVAFAALAILTVSYGKKYAFCASCIMGMLMECMLANVPVFYLVAYPVITMLCAQFFADMSDRKREKLRLMRENEENKQKKLRFMNWAGKRRENDFPPMLRIPLCAGLMDVLLNLALCAYLYLVGVEMSMMHVQRLVGGALYTMALAALLMWPLRRFYLGMYVRRKRRKEGGVLL